jgi:uncharacterized membrane protein
MESENQRLRARVEELERRLEEVERRVGILPVPAAAAPPELIPEPAPAPPPLPVLPREADTVETKAGLVWVNRIGAVTVILSVAFGFKYAVDNEWIGPSGRVMLGLIAAGLAVLAGDKLWGRGHKSFAHGITALGVCIFYLSFYAAYQLYSLIPQSVAFLGAVVTTAAGGALALRYDARAIAVLALFGGYLSPVLASSGVPNDRFLGGYLFVLNAMALMLARRKQWLSVEVAAALGTLAIFAGWFLDAGHRLDPVEGSLFVALQVAVFSLSPFFRIRALAPIPAMLAIAFVCGQYGSPAYWFWGGVVSVLMLAGRDARMLGVSFAGWAIGFWVWEHRWASDWSVFAGLTAGFLGYFAAAATGRSRAAHTALAANAIFYYGACYASFNDVYHGYMGLLALVVAAVYLAGAARLHGSVMALVSAGVALSFVTLAIPIQLSGYSITLAWAVESAVLAYLAVRLASRWAFIGSWVIAGLALGMLFGQDAGRAWGAEYTPVVNARFVPFLVTAVSLALNAYWSGRPWALLPLLAAHFTLLAGLHLEVFAWIKSGTDTDLTSRLTFASSLLLAAYGLATLAHGISREFRVHRILGLALFGIVVGKLYLFDIWQLARLYRILAFVAIGGLLLSGSYLYSRYRHRLVALLQDEPHTAA